ncbi:MAG TPA: hypothetical protein VEJ23_02295 [Solirubrobacteraceae bacterium]|nr:hypothetical protein [Solirubrobacteraceae bacterium]
MRELAGQVYIDHGGVALVDPLYAELSDADREAILTADPAVRLDCDEENLPEGGLGLYVATGLGDGSYPVYADVIDVPSAGKRVARIVIDCLGTEDESDELRERLAENTRRLREQTGWNVRLPFETGAADDDVRRRALGEEPA